MSTARSFDRLHQALRGPRDRLVLMELAEAWPPIRSWWAAPLEGVAPGDDVLGFDASISDEETTAGGGSIPGEQTFSFAAFHLVQGAHATEYGVELEYALDDDWLETLRSWPAWDADHPIGFHVWGSGDAGFERFADSIERLVIFQLALIKPCIRLRLYGPDGEDHIALRGVPGQRLGSERDEV